MVIGTAWRSKRGRIVRVENTEIESVVFSMQTRRVTTTPIPLGSPTFDNRRR
jgi:hypothetical protein